MIGHSLRNTPGVRPQSTWVFVQAPLGATRAVLFSWDGRKGVIYCSRAQFRRIQNDPWNREFFVGVAGRIEANYWGEPHSEGVDFLDTNECVNAQSISRWLRVATENPKMRQDAFIIFSMIAQVDPDVELPFIEWVEQLPAAV